MSNRLLLLIPEFFIDKCTNKGLTIWIFILGVDFFSMILVLVLVLVFIFKFPFTSSTLGIIFGSFGKILKGPA